MKHFYISSQQSCFVKKGVLENFTNILEKNLLWILFLIKACNFIKSRLQRRCFPLKCTKFFRTYPCYCFYTQIKFFRMPVTLKKRMSKQMTLVVDTGHVLNFTSYQQIIVMQMLNVEGFSQIYLWITIKLMISSHVARYTRRMSVC